MILAPDEHDTDKKMRSREAKGTNHIFKRKFCFNITIVFQVFHKAREKGRDLTRSYDKSPFTHRKTPKASDNTQTPPKSVITQRLLTDLGRSVGVTKSK